MRRSFCKLLAQIPLALKVPIIVAALTILVAVAISQVVLGRLAKEQSRALANLTSAFLDGLSASVTPGMIRKDVWETFDALDRVRHQYGDIKVLFIVAALPNGDVLAASEPERFPTRSSMPQPLADFAADKRELITDERAGKAWLVRPIRQEGYLIGTVIAEIDIANLLAVRREVLLTLLLVNGGLTLIFSAAGYFLVRRMISPLSLIQAKLAGATVGHLDLISDRDIARVGGEYSEVFRQFNAMIQGQAEREALSAELANQEKLVMLGRLASGMAHEVNNPLGGLMNAVDTLDVYGEDRDTRRRIIDLLRRGLDGIQHVVRAALITYKSGDQPLLLTHADLEDLPFLIQHETGSKHLALSWENSLPDQVLIDAAAIRQISLNLLLNACTASPEHSTVSFVANLEGANLVIAISDEGNGIPLEALTSIQIGLQGNEPPRGKGLGLWTAGRLAARLGGMLSIDSSQRSGSRLRLVVPIAQDEEVSRAVA